MSFGGWSQQVCVADRLYVVGVEPGKRVRIMYKPRGPGAYGYKWHGFVRSADDGARVNWSDEVPGSLGVRGLLIDAGILTRVSDAPKINKPT